MEWESSPGTDNRCPVICSDSLVQPGGSPRKHTMAWRKHGLLSVVLTHPRVVLAPLGDGLTEVLATLWPHGDN